MAFTILTQMAKPGSDMFYDPAFRLMIETHINILRTENITRQAIPENHYYQYEGDFYGYLVGEGVPANLHWIYLRVNNMYNPSEFAKDLRDPYQVRSTPYLLIPHEATLSDIQRMYISIKNK